VLLLTLYILDHRAQAAPADGQSPVSPLPLKPFSGSAASVHGASRSALPVFDPLGDGQCRRYRYNQVEVVLYPADRMQGGTEIACLRIDTLENDAFAFWGDERQSLHGAPHKVIMKAPI